MKKLFLTLAVATIAIAASAQVYVGGQIGLYRDTDDNNTTFKILPEIGYTFNEHISVGSVIGYAYAYDSGNKVDQIEFSPYLRYTYAKLGPVQLFCDANAGFTYYKFKPKNGADSDDTYWHAYLKPGIAVHRLRRCQWRFQRRLLRQCNHHRSILQFLIGHNNRVDVGISPQHLSLHRTYGVRIRHYIHIGVRKL